ncbi:MAG TPA: ABC transporter permease, partial [bacterium]|nr:ABC transporter permease [bacterium]
MLRHQFKILIRNIRKHPGHFLLILGNLALGFAACFAIVLYIYDEVSYDRFHSQEENIYRLTMDITEEGTTREFVMTPPMGAPDLKAEFPAVQEFVRLRKTAGTVSTSDHRFREENVFYADSTFFRVFSLRLLKGNPRTVLRRPYTVVITESMAEKYFGNDNPIGRTLQIQPGFQQDQQEVEVTGVVEDPPDQSHFHLQCLISMTTLDARELRSYSHTVYYSYLLLHPEASGQELEAQFPGFLTRQSGPEATEWLTLHLQPITDIHLRSHREGEIEANSSLLHLYILGTIAVFVLFISAMNFINLSIARAGVRLPDIGVRKVFGAGRHSLIAHFLFESVLLAGLAGLLALVILDVALPLLQWIAARDLSLWQSTSLVVPSALLLLILFTGLASGVYPALALTGDWPVTALSGRRKPRFRGANVSKVLVVAQFALSVILIVGTLTAWRQLRFVQNKELGFAEDQLVVLPLQLTDNSAETLAQFKHRLLRHTGIEAVTGSRGVLGRGVASSTFYPGGEAANQPRIMRVLHVDADFIATYGMSLTAGRDFSRTTGMEREAVILNQTAVDLL